MKPKLRVANPPQKPLMLYDGDCTFCKLWIHRWQIPTGDFVEYLPFQDPQGAARFPEIPRPHFDTAVQLIMPDGSVFSAAEAVYRSLACNPQEQWLLELYQHSPLFVWISETAYSFVARHRTIFSALTQLLWGRHLEPPQQNLVRWIFLRALGLIYLAAFISLWTQITDLAGSHGILPVTQRVEAARQNFDALSIGLNRYHLLPTLCWFNTSDAFLNLQCAAGTIFAGLLVANVASAPCLFLLWLVYLSLTTVCAGTHGFGWSNLLLETGFLAIFFAPLQLRPRRPLHESPPSRIALWLLRWLLFRLMFASGCLNFPQADASWFKPAADVLIFIFNYVLPFAIFLPRKPREVACIAFIISQIVLLPSSQQFLFNFLAMTLCLILLDDAAIQSLLPHKWRSLSLTPSRRSRHWPMAIELAVMMMVVCASYSQFFLFLGIRVPGPEPVVALNQWLQPFRSFNSYHWPP